MDLKQYMLENFLNASTMGAKAKIHAQRIRKILRHEMLITPSIGQKIMKATYHEVTARDLMKNNLKYYEKLEEKLK